MTRGPSHPKPPALVQAARPIKFPIGAQPFATENGFRLRSAGLHGYGRSSDVEIGGDRT